MGLSFLKLQAQDPHFSQIINAPVLLNPALTGVMNSDARVMINYRSQWASVSTPFQTMAMAIDFSPLRYAFNTDDILGVGMYIMRDKAGLSELSQTQVQLNLAFSKSLNGQGNNYLSIGGQMGYGNQNINFQNLTFDNQIEGNVLNTSLSSGEVNLLQGLDYWDVSAGVSWAYKPEKSQAYYLGASIFHINEPKVSFMDDDTELLYRKYTVYAGLEFRLNYLVSLMPRTFYLQQGPATELTAGSLIKFNMERSRNRHESAAFMLGALYRFRDALILIARYDFQNFGLSFSYDASVSGIRRATSGYGAMEFAAHYKMNFSRRNRRGRTIVYPSF